ncbi:MAG: hypothetical protein ACK44D_09650 [Bacteroidia bacterium]
MKIDCLNEIVRIFGYYQSEDENLISEAARNAFDYEPLILKFNDELQTNIVTNRPHAQDVVRLYLERLGRIARVVQPDLLDEDVPENDTDKYFYYCSLFINEAFSMVQFNCRDFKIDFHKIMHELKHDELYSIIETFPDEPQNIEGETTPPGPEIDFDVDAALKICLLHELGVIDLLRLKGFGSNNKMAQLIGFLTKEPIKTGAANVTLGRIQNDGLVDKYQSELAALKLKFGITQ